MRDPRKVLTELGMQDYIYHLTMLKKSIEYFQRYADDLHFFDVYSEFAESEDEDFESLLCKIDNIIDQGVLITGTGETD